MVKFKIRELKVVSQKLILVPHQMSPLTNSFGKKQKHYLRTHRTVKNLVMVQCKKIKSSVDTVNNRSVKMRSP